MFNLDFWYEVFKNSPNKNANQFKVYYSQDRSFVHNVIEFYVWKIQVIKFIRSSQYQLAFHQLWCYNKFLFLLESEYQIWPES